MFQFPREDFRLHVGWRTIKTAVTAILVAVVYCLLERNPAFACIGVIFGLGTDMPDSIKNGGNRLFGTLIGGLLAIAVFWVYLRFYPQGGHSMLLALLLGAAIVVLILLCQYFWPGGVQPGGVVLCIVLFSTPVETYVVHEDKRQRMYNFVRKLVGEGRQAYIICPAVEDRAAQEGAEGEPVPFADLKAVKSYAQHLQDEVFPDLRLALLHGKMRPKEKDAVMAAFAAGDVDVLVSTTVVEVGVDVPNAALIIVENAERFGLSQLHQLRGRVGRGKHQSYCVLITNSHAPDAMTRLKTLASTTDGFKISEEDLKLRGPGDFFGSRQHGLPQLALADLSGDMRLLQQAQQSARQLLQQDPTLSQPENRPVLDRVRQMFVDTPDIFN